MFLHMSVILLTGGLVSVSVPGKVSVPGGLCPRGSLSEGVICPGVSNPGGSTQRRPV